MAFPTLTQNPISIDYQHEDATVKTEFEAGYVQARERHTRDRLTFSVAYSKLTAVNRASLLAHYASVRGSGAFDWTDPDTATVYSVRYDVPPKYKANAVLPGAYDVSLTLKEV